MSNKYDIKTMKDILNAVNEENKENFLEDFSSWLGINIEMKNMVDSLGGEMEANFIWIDDGKNDIDLKIEVRK